MPKKSKSAEPQRVSLYLGANDLRNLDIKAKQQYRSRSNMVAMLIRRYCADTAREQG